MHLIIYNLLVVTDTVFGLSQATVGPCNVPKPRSWSPIEQSKWTRFAVIGFYEIKLKKSWLFRLVRQ